jgi:hypothetical protein
VVVPSTLDDGRAGGVTVIGLMGAAALLLGAAGLAKAIGRVPDRPALVAARIPVLDRWTGPAGARVTGLGELLVAVLALAIGGRLGAALLMLAYLSLAAVSWRMMSVAAGQDCGCFGRPTPISHAHTAVNSLFALACAVGLAIPPGNLASELRTQPWAGLPLILAAVLLAYLGYVVMTIFPELLRTRALVAARP